jgi:hypothetical protein
MRVCVCAYVCLCVHVVELRVSRRLLCSVVCAVIRSSVAAPAQQSSPLKRLARDSVARTCWASVAIQRRGTRSLAPRLAWSSYQV